MVFINSDKINGIRGGKVGIYIVYNKVFITKFINTTGGNMVH